MPDEGVEWRRSSNVGGLRGFLYDALDPDGCVVSLEDAVYAIVYLGFRFIVD